MTIVETLKEFTILLLGQQIRVYTDHKNLTYKAFIAEQVMQWRLILEEYRSELMYTQISKNITADALSRLDIVDTLNPVKNNIESLNEHYGLEDEYALHTTKYKTNMQKQQKDKDLINIAQNNKDYSIQNFQGTNEK